MAAQQPPQELPWGPVPRPVPTAYLPSHPGSGTLLRMDLTAFTRFPASGVRTERLELRMPRGDDVSALHAYRSVPDVCRYVPFYPQSEQELLERIGRAERDLSAAAPNLWAVAVDVATGALVGDVVLMTASVEHSCGEVGYVVSPEHVGRGYATEAARAAVDFGFRDVGFRRIIGRVDARNLGSARVLERLGMRREAHLLQNEWFKEEWTDELDYAVLAAEWPGIGPAR